MPQAGERGKMTPTLGEKMLARLAGTQSDWQAITGGYGMYSIYSIPHPGEHLLDARYKSPETCDTLNQGTRLKTALVYAEESIKSNIVP